VSKITEALCVNSVIFIIPLLHSSPLVVQPFVEHNPRETALFNFDSAR